MRILAGILLFGLFLNLNFIIFQNYQNNLVQLQSGNLLTIVKAVANNLSNYYSESLDSFDLYFDNLKGSEMIAQYCSRKEDMTSVVVADMNGHELYRFGAEYSSYIPELIKDYQLENRDGSARLLKPVLTKEHEFIQFIVKEIDYQKQEKTYLIASLDMNHIYEKIVKPIKIGKNGYSMVKSYDGIILMHNTQSQIGMDSVTGRQEKYKDYDLSLEDLEMFVEEQRANPEGARILETYWWDDLSRPKGKKVVAFTQISIGDERWIVNGTLDYKELENPLRVTQIMVLLVLLISLALFGILIFFVISNRNRNQNMVTELKHLRELNDALGELRKREEQLRHGDKIKTIGTMTGMISHEFNNFLTPILLYGDLLIQDPSINEVNKECIAEIIESAQKAGELTKEISLYGRKDKGSYKKIHGKVSEQVKRSLAMIEKILPTNVNLSITLEDEGDYDLIASQGTVYQIVVNLCTNAIHAMRKDGGDLTVFGKVRGNDGQMKYEITIKDTGEGIPRDRLEQIFTPFFTTKESGEGTGLGLAVIQDLIHQVSGEIAVQSREMEGSLFTIIFPLCRREMITANSQNPPNTNRRKRIFLLEDNGSVHKAFHKVLAEEYPYVEMYKDPAAALGRLKEKINIWDVIITDYSMPVMNGIELASILRSLGYSGRIILMTGNLEPDVQWYLENGIIDWILEKPISLNDFREAVKS